MPSTDVLGVADAAEGDALGETDGDSVAEIEGLVVALGVAALGTGDAVADLLRVGDRDEVAEVAKLTATFPIWGKGLSVYKLEAP